MRCFDMIYFPLSYIDECTSGTHNCSSYAMCDKQKEDFNAHARMKTLVVDILVQVCQCVCAYVSKSMHVKALVLLDVSMVKQCQYGRLILCWQSCTRYYSH